MTQDIGAEIIEKAKSLGASLAGIASVEELKKSPSYELHDKLSIGIEGVGPSQGFLKVKELKWPENAKSALVIALSHPYDKPELDWAYDNKYKTSGNLQLVKINEELSPWIEEKYGIKTHHVPYYIAERGVYLKDSAVLSGLGCIGKNNLLVTPEFGPKIRLRAMLLDEELASTGPIDFDPCEDCEEYCHKECPQNALDEIVLSPDITGMSNLPARIGSYSRPKCSIQSSTDAKDSDLDFYNGFWAEKIWDESKEEYQTEKYMKICRRCELSCPVGT